MVPALEMILSCSAPTADTINYDDPSNWDKVGLWPVSQSLARCSYTLPMVNGHMYMHHNYIALCIHCKSNMPPLM